MNDANVSRERDAAIRVRVAAGEPKADVARDFGISRQRVQQLTDYVCLDHSGVSLTVVRTIRADIARPLGAVVVGDCSACQAKGRRHGLSYGKVRSQP